MVIFKIRHKDTGLFKVKRPLGASASLKWDLCGDCYATEGIARSAAKAAIRANSSYVDRLQIVLFETKEIGQISV